MPYNVAVAQGLALFTFLVQCIAACLLHLPVAFFRCFLASLRKQKADERAPGCTFYEGSVMHERHKPVHNAFRSLLIPPGCLTSGTLCEAGCLSIEEPNVASA